MEQRIRRFKQTLRREMPRRGRGLRFSADVVAEAVRIAEYAKTKDWSIPEVARALGLGAATLARWCERVKEAEQYPGVMQPVAVVPPARSPDSGGLVVHGPASMRVDGLGLDELVELWRKLS